MIYDKRKTRTNLPSPKKRGFNGSKMARMKRLDLRNRADDDWKKEAAEYTTRDTRQE